MFVSNSVKLCPTKIDVEWPKSNSGILESASIISSNQAFF